MSIFNQADINTPVSFELFGSAIAGDFKACRILSMGSGLAYSEFNPREKHDAIYSSLPNPAPRAFTDYIYYLIMLSNGKMVIVGDAWIKPNTVIRGSANRAVIVVNNVNASDLSTLERLIRSGNYNVHDIRIEE